MNTLQVAKQTVPPDAAVADICTLPLDADLPGLDIAWNPAQLREHLARALVPRRGWRFDLVDCALSRFRYREGTRAIMLYSLTLRDRDSGRERQQWVTGTVYPGKRARRRYRELASQLSQAAVPESVPFEPAAFLPGLGMLVQLFPIDRYLPTLATLADAPPPELQNTFLEAFGPGAWRVQGCEVQPMRYRASMGATLRYTVRALDQGSGWVASRDFYAKVYRDSGEDTFRLLQGMYQASAEQGFGAVRPLAYLPELRTLVLDAAPGKPLDRALLDGESIGEIGERAARALANLHRSDLPLAGYRTKADMLVRVQRATTFIQWACPELGAKVREIYAELDARLENPPGTPAHLDIKPDHIFLDDDRVTLIDLDSASLGEPTLDPASLVARLEAAPHVMSMPEATALGAARAFIESYLEQVPAAWAGRLGPAYACAALKVALFFVQHQQPRWRHLAADFVERAGNGLASNSPPPFS